MTEEVKIQFVLGDKLPTYYEAAISIFNVASKPSSPKMIKAVRSYATSLVEVWEKSFSSKHVISFNAVLGRLTKLVSFIL